MRQDIRKYFKDRLENDIIPFWDNRIIDSEYGGYFNCFDEKGNIFDTKKSGWFLGRTIYMYSYLYNNLDKNKNWLKKAKIGVDFLINKFYLNDYRFALYSNRDGSILDKTKSIHTDHFVAKGLIEYIVASNDKKHLFFLEKMLDTLFENAKDTKLMEEEGVEKGYKKHSISFMSLLVAMESRKLFNKKYSNEIDYFLNECLYVFADDRHNAVFEYVNMSSVKKDELAGHARLIDIGHGFEALWFCMEEGIKRGDTTIVNRAQQALDWLIDLGYDKENGGFYELVDIYNKIPEQKHMYSNYDGVEVKYNDKIWWVQVEILYALLLSGCKLNNKKHYDLFLKHFDYCKKHFVDEDNKEWFSVLSVDNKIKDARKGSMVKGFYHVPRTYMNIVLLLKS